MGNLDLDIEAFVSNYVNYAFDCTPSESSISLAEFGRTVAELVSKKMGIPLQVISYLNHPIHWSLFHRDRQSPLEILQPMMRGEGFFMKQTQNNYDWREETKRYILEKYRVLLESKLKLIHISPQSA
jgi:hypothetical protein